MKKIMLNVEHWQRRTQRRRLRKQGSVCTCMCVCLCAHACMHAVGGFCCFKYVCWIAHLQALLLLLCFHGDIVTYCCTEDSVSVHVFVRRN